MDSLKKIYLFVSALPVVIIFLIIMIVMMVINASNENVPDVPLASVDGFSVPFNSDVKYIVTSDFGMRIDPISHEQSLHSGIDLSAPAGTDIVASASGKVHRISLNKDSLGNYVELEHVVDGVTYYTGYGHMSNDSIVVQEGQEVKAKQKLGVIGMTGRATGIHVHFSLMSPKPIFNLDNLKDPRYIIDADLKSKS